MKKLNVSFLLVLFFTSLQAQDIHWSQPGAALVYVNPAFTGVLNRYSMGVNFRDQWSPVNNSYKTFAAMGEYRLTADDQPSQLGAGLIIYNDNSANGAYKVSSGGLNFSCLLKVSEVSKIGGGIYYGFMQGSLNTGAFTWGNQFNGESYDASLNSGEERQVLNRSSTDLGAGISYLLHAPTGNMSDNNPDYLLAGYSAAHINRPDIGINTSERLDMKHTLYVTFSGSMSDNRGLKPTVMLNMQGKMMEVVFGTLVRFDFGATSMYTGMRKGSSFSAGALYRVKDAVIPTIEYEKSNYSLGISYDINLSRFSKISRYQGGLEIHLKIRSLGTYEKTSNKPTHKPTDAKPMY